MGKSTHFTGQPVLSQLIKPLESINTEAVSRRYNGERYVKSFTAREHLVIMVYAAIMRFDSLREIEDGTYAEARKLAHVGVRQTVKRSTLSDANARRDARIFGLIYHKLYERHSRQLLADSRTRGWWNRLKIIDSTTITLFSNLIFKGVGRNPKTGRKKGGVKVHTVINANEGVPCDIRFTSAATHDHFMLIPDNLQKGTVMAMDRAYIDYEKFERMTELGVIYVTKMKRNLTFETLSDSYVQSPEGLTHCRIRTVIFSKKTKDRMIKHTARLITYFDGEKKKPVELLTNDMEMNWNDIAEIYHCRWLIELLFKQLKQNFPLRYFYGESANAIKIQIWAVLIANLLLTLKKQQVRRKWSYSGMATTLRIILMSYIDFNSFFENPEKDSRNIVRKRLDKPPQELTLF